MKSQTDILIDRPSGYVGIGVNWKLLRMRDLHVLSSEPRVTVT